jgi:hypothetical protein
MGGAMDVRRGRYVPLEATKRWAEGAALLYIERRAETGENLPSSSAAS